MRKLVAVIAASAALTMLPVVAADLAAAKDKAKSTEGAPTSDRSPGKQTTTPNSQVDTTANGQTSDRTPRNSADGAASGEKGVGSGSASQQSWDDTYTSDKAQEKQLKAGGKS
jgi:hypothetical protein